ncbi:extracellular solute-binding protein [Paenibacillus psychroresistens]|uniref:Extracellular solute-binding protein n=1 Tax=Paenibacillus psychroresistens TaxID=1778678 RepID=A0A6B8RRD2_9BACL|nr:extracellular solute-binding protein [Paenibacillus psychroresistens]QGQ98043.1 extracellular solute-binding protein [Paenibacillus psychroresistens]
MNRTLSVLLILTLLFLPLVSGCSKSDFKANKSKVELENTTSPESQTIVKLRVSGFKSGSEIGAIPQINEQFMKENPTIKVTYEGMPGAQYSEFIKSKFATNDASDVIMLNPGISSVGSYSKAGFIRDLSDQPWIKDFTPSVIEAISINGKIYGTPNEMVVLGVYYNKEIFTKLALKTPTNWDEFLAVCEAIKSEGLTPISIGNNDGWMTLAALYSMGSSLIKDPDFDKKINARSTKFNGTWNEMVNQWFSLNDKGYLTPKSTSISLDQAQKDFVGGKAGMYIDGSWSLAGLLKINPNMKLGMFAMPANKAGEETVVSASIGTTWTINARTKNLAAAQLYLAYWAKKATLMEWAKSQASFITLKDVTSDIAPELSEISHSLATGKSHSYLSTYWEQSEAAQNEMMASAQGVYLKAVTIDQMLTNMDNAWDRAVKQEEQQK